MEGFENVVKPSTLIETSIIHRDTFEIVSSVVDIDIETFNTTSKHNFTRLPVP